MPDPSTYRPALGTIPTDPGVYRFFDEKDQVIYVGKAKNLRNRLNSYFADPQRLHFRTKMMVHTACRVEWTVVATEAESLQLEYTWIKQYSPRFNVRFKDDKSYPWLCVTWSDRYPRVFIGRGVKKRGWRYYGPFGQAWAVRKTLDVVLKIFPIRSCTNAVFRNAELTQRPCLKGHIKLCSAPCVGWIGEDEYRELVRNFSYFWAGRTSGLERKLRAQMKRAADEQEYEKAAVIRDSLSALQQVSERSAIVLSDGTDTDVIAHMADELHLAIQVFHIRHGRVLGERGSVAERDDDRSIAEMIEHFCWSLYSEDDRDDISIPPQILVDELPSSSEALTQLLCEKAGHRVDIHIPQRGDKVQILQTVKRNAEQMLTQHKLKRSADLSARSQALEDLQDYLQMSQPPLRIEGFDISHLLGNQVVGSMVVFEDGMPRTSEYRRFIISSFEGSNDIAAMDEILSRRCRRLLDDDALAHSANCDDHVDPSTGKARRFSYRPSLFVVDGGLPQVNAAAKVLKRFHVDDEIMLIGLAKR